MRATRRVPVYLCLLVFALVAISAHAGTSPPKLQREIAPKQVYTKLESYHQTDHLVMKLAEGMGQPVLAGKSFNRTGGEWNRLNELLASPAKTASVTPHFAAPKETLDNMRAVGSARIEQTLPDLSLYYKVNIDASATETEKIELINELNKLGIVENAWFAPRPELAWIKGGEADKDPPLSTPNWEAQQYYLQPAPTGLDAYYAWSLGNKGQDVMVIDIEGNWSQTQEDLHGGTDDFHIAGSRINEPDWYHHGTAVLGEIAADSNSFGMTGISFNVDLGTVSIGSMSTADALITATNASDTGDIILIELHAPGPDASGIGQDGYVAMEYWQDNFDAILTASALGRIVVEAAGNGAENFDDQGLYGSLFDPDVRWSGAVMVGASDNNHWPASFTNYGERVDVHGFGTWDVYTLGYGDLYGSSVANYYTGSFAGTSSASPIIVGACALLQEIHKSTHGRILYEDEMHQLLTDFSTPQQPHFKNIGPLPNLRGSVDQILGVSFFADTTVGWAPLDVSFSASSGLAVDTWDWTFGDGAVASGQNPSHQYTTRGHYDVSVEIDAGGDLRTATRNQYVAVLADSMWAEEVEVDGPGTIEVTVHAANTLPTSEFRVPVEYAGVINLVYDSFSTEGCRTDYFELQEQINWAPQKLMTFRLLSSLNFGAPSLEAGSGPILKIYFSVSGTPTAGQSTDLVLDGYSPLYMPRFTTNLIEFEPWTFDGLAISPNCCSGIRGNINGDPLEQIDVSDLVYLVAYMFTQGPEPPCFKEANVDGDIFEEITIGDLVWLVDYMFNQGTDPAICF